MFAVQTTESAAFFEIISNPESFSALCDVLMLIVTIISVVYAYRAYQHQKDRCKKETACNLAKYYASNIIDKYGDIEYVFNTSGISKIIRDIFPLNKLQEFDKDELDRLFQEASLPVKDFEEKLHNIDPMSILGAQMSRACTPEERTNMITSYTKLDDDGKPKVVNELYLRVDFEREISGLLNELEWFAMNCRYGLADEELMYQSLHKTYISTVWMLYYYISHRNENNEDKLYTNLVWLFIKWRDRLSMIKQKTEAKRQKHLKKAAALKPKVHEGSPLK